LAVKINILKKDNVLDAKIKFVNTRFLLQFTTTELLLLDTCIILQKIRNGNNAKHILQ